MGSNRAAFPPAPKPETLLAWHRVLSPQAGVRVSPLCLGTMNFGDQWQGMMGECSKETSFEILDYYFEKGGNFIDTANNYQFEESEIWLGEWMKERGNRDQIVLATKYTTMYQDPRQEGRTVEGSKPPRWFINYQGNHTKSLHLSVEASLKKLQTGYIDLLYVHWWDFTTSIEEVMQSLNVLVQSGKVLYLGVSDTPAWVVSKANQYARDHGMRGFSVYQGLWSASERDFERDIIPMVRAENMALAPWGALGRGQFLREAERAAKTSGRIEVGVGPSPKIAAISAALEKVADRKGKGLSLTSIALAYVMHKSPYVFPIIGGRSVKHLEGNIAALEIELTEEDVKEIESAYEWDPGFPYSFLFGAGYTSESKTGDMGLMRPAGFLDTVPLQKNIKPHKP